MTKAEVLALVQDMARDQADDTTISAYHDEVIEELAKSEDPPFVALGNFALTSGVSEYSWPSSAIRPLYMWYDGYQLSQSKEHRLSAYDIEWRDSSGDPVAWRIDNETARTLRVMPTPDSDSTTTCKILYSQERTTYLHDFIVPYIVFRILYKEFIRPSDHQDIDWAKLCQQVAQLFYILGVRRKRDEEGTM